MKKLRAVTINSTLIYITAFIMTSALHESSHALVGSVFNTNPVLHHNFVEHFPSIMPTINANVLIAVAGPITSLVQGIVFGFLFLRSRYRDLVNLFVLWSSVLGLNNFLGYVMTGPFAQSGDIGKVWQLLGVPVWIQIMSVTCCSLILLYVAYRLTVPFLSFANDPMWLESSSAKQSFSFHILILPWLMGSFIITLLYLPIVAIVSIVYPVMSGMVFIFPWQNARRAANVSISNTHSVSRLSVFVALATIALVLVFRVILAAGIRV